MGHTTLFIRNEHKYSVVGEIVTSHLSCPTVPVLVLLPPEAAAFSEPGPASCRLAEDSGAACTHYHSLGVAEHSGDPKTQLLILYREAKPLELKPSTNNSNDNSPTVILLKPHIISMEDSLV